MQKLRSVLLVMLSLAVVAAAARSQESQHNYVPPAGYVPDAATAVSIAEAVLIPVYGRERIERQRPFTAVRSGDTWTVSGYLPRGRLGGVALVELSRRDARILRMTHGR